MCKPTKHGEELRGHSGVSKWYERKLNRFLKKKTDRFVKHARPQGQCEVGIAVVKGSECVEHTAKSTLGEDVVEEPGKGEGQKYVRIAYKSTCAAFILRCSA